MRIVSTHLHEAKRVLEVYEQFDEVIKGPLARRVNIKLHQLEE